MLETEEVDVDYFTPSTSTSLSNLFGSSSKKEDTAGSSLKYSAPLPPQITSKNEETKQIEYLFAGTVYAYEWVNNTYQFKGKLGFAIYKLLNLSISKMVIYDSNKTTLSTVTIVNDIEIKVTENTSISYYDSLQKFWSINPAPNLNKILDVLKFLNVNLNYVDTEHSEPGYIDKDKINQTKLNLDEKESDTDTSSNKKTKDSILKRMATMGQSVLPPSHKAQSSDSSDSGSHNQHIHRQRIKATIKKGVDKKSLETDNICCLKSDIPQNIVRDPIDTSNQQIVSLKPTDAKPTEINAGTETNNISLFLTEQRVSNSEIRINMNRMTDKLDILLGKVNDLGNVNKIKFTENNNVSQLQNEITQKLLNEYERKIKKYEDFLKLKGYNCDTFEQDTQEKSDNLKVFHQSAKDLSIEAQHLKQICNEKDKEIMQIKNDLMQLTDKTEKFHHHERNLLEEINDLKNNLTLINNKETNSLPIKLKEIMNDTFQAISIHFDDNETYTGTKIKNIVGSVVKKTTIDSLKEF